MRWALSRWWFWLAASLVVASISLLLFCWTHRIWSLNEWRVYQAMDAECHPVWQDFHYERIQAGDSVEDIIAQYPPIRVERSGRWVVLKYHGGALCNTGITAAAYDGQMVGAFAWSCTWVRQFFDSMSKDQRIEFYRDHYDQIARVGNVILVR